MYLKSIEIQGFKSFPDNTVINLSRGVTAIVGPNGSGKSNIVDAVKWVLGEQSSKNLRGGKMEDVIFGGTVKRPPSSYSKVSLTIDHSERLLPIDYGEVTVTRRYGRNGDSEFFINRKSVRLKDIHELFMDTGLGRDGYSVIGQGRIDEILSIKSEDRREIFEEAAGITKFRYRKEEAEKRLSGTEENLVRIRDIASTLESSLEPMRQAAEKTKKYFALYEDAKKTEVSIWLSESERLRERIKEISAEHTIADRNLSVRKSELDGIYDSIEKTGEYDVQYRVVRKDGTRLWVDDKGRSITTEDGRKAMVSVMLDISDGVRLQERLKKEVLDTIRRRGPLIRWAVYLVFIIFLIFNIPITSGQEFIYFQF